MSRSASQESLTRLSLLDRLLDEDPSVSEEVPLSKVQRARQAQGAIRRDLQDLLNTRYRCLAWPPQLDQLPDSLINYGIPDFTAAGLDMATEAEPGSQFGRPSDAPGTPAPGEGRRRAATDW